METELTRVDGLGLHELRSLWRAMTQQYPPKVLSRDLLARMNLPVEASESAKNNP